MTDRDIIHINSGGGLEPRKRELTTDDLIEQCLSETQNIMEVSKDRYRKSMKRYFKWVAEVGFDLQRITFSEILEYRKYLEKKRNKAGELLSPYTIGAYLIAVKIFYDWAHAKGIYPINPCATLKMPGKTHKYKRKPLDPEQMELLFAHFKKQSLRDYAIIRTLYYCGLRTIELVRIDFGDIEVVKDVRRVNIQGKGKTSKDRWVKLRDEAYNPIMEYLKSRNIELHEDTPVFVSESFVGAGERLTQGTISRIVKAGLKAIGLDSRKYTAHGIRSSAGTNAIRKGATLAQVQDMLRHASDTTTKGYVSDILDEDRNKNKSAEDFL